MFQINLLLIQLHYFQVLRFSRLFGPGKPNSLPNIWKNVRKKHKKRKHKESNPHDSDSNSDEEKPKHRGWDFDYAEPKPELVASDDEVFL